MPKPTIHIGLEGEKIIKYVPHRARHLVRGSLFVGKNVDLVTFPYDPKKIIKSAAIKRVLAKIGRQEGVLVIVGWDFTVEAREILNGLAAVVLSGQNFGWTDERLSTIKQG